MNGQLLLAKTSADSCARVLRQRGEVAVALTSAETKDMVKQILKPNSISRTLRSAGVALLLAPDPLTGVPGAIMVGASLAMRKREPSNVESVVNETRRMIAELGSFL